MRSASDTDLVRIRNAFDSWRSSRSSRSIPDHLWLKAVSLLDRYSLARVSRELRLNSARLRQRQLSSFRPSLPPLPSPSFVELPSPSPPLALLLPSEAVSESDSLRLLIERADGFRLTLFLPLSESDRLTSLCSLFLGSET